MKDYLSDYREDLKKNLKTITVYLDKSCPTQGHRWNRDDLSIFIQRSGRSDGSTQGHRWNRDDIDFDQLYMSLMRAIGDEKDAVIAAIIAQSTDVEIHYDLNENMKVKFMMEPLECGSRGGVILEVPKDRSHFFRAMMER